MHLLSFQYANAFFETFHQFTVVLLLVCYFFQLLALTIVVRLIFLDQ